MSVSLIISFNIMMLIVCGLFSMAKNSRVVNYIFLFASSFAVGLYAIQRDFDYGDTLHYVNFYLSDHTYLSFEPLFDSIARIFMGFFPTEPVYFLFLCAMTTSMLYFMAYRNLVGVSGSYLAYWMLVSTFSFHYLIFEVIRTGLATAFILLAVSCLIKNNSWFKYYLFVVVAIGFHYSAVFFLFLRPLLSIKKEAYYYLILIFVGVMGKFIFIEVGSRIGLSVITDKLEYYLVATNESQTILIRNLMMASLLPIVYRVTQNKIYFNYYFLYILVLATTFGIEEINRRYLFIGPVLLICILWKYLQDKIGIAVCIIFLYFHVFLINYLSMYGLLNYEPLFKIF